METISIHAKLRNGFTWSPIKGYNMILMIIHKIWAATWENRIFSSPEPKAQKWAYSIPVEPGVSVRPSVRVSTLSNMNISETNGLITTKFYLKHHWVGGKAAFGFGSDRIRTLVSMATESSHRVVMEKTVSPLFLACFSSDPFHTCR